MHHRNAPAAIEFLCRAFGFAKHLLVPGPNSTIAHAQLVFGNGMIMLGSDPMGNSAKGAAAAGSAAHQHG
jgi:uncharacterized glyoxalase superfamily protein PhnB